MNISTGGPHLLLFERDQQLAALLISEFQLSGYDCHAARTAVEVFDAISRFQIKMVLVNLAQAATSRREFWVALDTQRRGRGVQVFTFHCSNIAAYGPLDPEDQPQNMHADMEIDGMLGLMSLVDAVRARIPTGSISQTLPRATLSPSRPLSQPLSPPTPGYQAPTIQEFPQTPSPQQHGNSEKIRAVLYPNQRTWNSSVSNNTYTNNSTQPLEQRAINPVNSNSTNATSMLQQLAGQNPSESSLAQLSRLLQDQRSSPQQAPYSNQQQATQPAPTQQQRPQQYDFSPSPQLGDLPVTPQHSFNAPPPEVNNQYSFQPNRPQQPQTPTQPELSLSSQPLRMAPIQDLPGEQRGSTSALNEVPRRDVLSRTNYTPSSSSSASLPSLSSLVMPSSFTSSTNTPATQAYPTPTPTKTTPVYKVTTQAYQTPQEEIKSYRKEPEEVSQPLSNEPTRTPPLEVILQNTNAATNTMLMDIVQSLPTLPPLPPGEALSMQTPVLNGRATRSLGSVLLAGHLVPANRLEVAENIQRMLRGVDLNYQLGDILLMFKLLTPDQLLAASLVSYGLISTTQISSLGRIRQELHSMGLEYDLENLLILFRILTPEQVREVRSNWQNAGV